MTKLLPLMQSKAHTHDSWPRPHTLDAHTGHPKVRLSWRAGAGESSRPFAPGRAQSAPVLIGRCFLIMQIICVDSEAPLPDVINHGVRSSGLSSGKARAGAQRTQREDLKPDPSVPPALSGPAPPPAPPLSSPPHPLLRPSTRDPAPCSASPPPPSWPSPAVQGGDGGTGGTGGTGGRADRAGIWLRRPEGQHRPPAPSRAWVSAPRTAASASAG